MKILIIGFGSSGYAALTTIKRISPKSDITIIDPKEFDLMHPCGIPYSLEGLIDPTLLYGNIHLNKMKVHKIKDRVKVFDAEKKQVILENGGAHVPFDACLLSTGSIPFIPPLEGVQLALGKRLHTLTNVDDLNRIKEDLTKSKEAVVIGAGAIGLEAAIALKKYIDHVAIVEMKEQVLPGILDSDLAKIVNTYLEDQGISVLTGHGVTEILNNGQFNGLIANGENISADLGILGTGFSPNISLFEEAGLACNKNGLIVDKFLSTSVKDIYGAGDCISGWSIIDNEMIPAKLATSAYKQGIIAGQNITGASKEYFGTAGTFVTKIGELEVAGTGFTTETARTKGYNPIVGKIKSNILPDYFPGNKEISVKVIFDNDTKKILGAQAIGFTGAAERINIISSAIEFGITIEEIGRVEMAYCPAVSEVYDPLLRAIDFGLRRMKKP